LHLGFSEMIAAGRLGWMPKLHAVQAEACAPLLVKDVEARSSVAEGILTAKPPRLAMLKKAVAAVAAVSEEEIIDGFRALGRQGINAEPTSAVVVPALRKLPIPAADSVLVILTGSGLKSAFL
jgi:threonine synthase